MHAEGVQVWHALQPSTTQHSHTNALAPTHNVPPLAVVCGISSTWRRHQGAMLCCLAAAHALATPFTCSCGCRVQLLASTWQAVSVSQWVVGVRSMRSAWYMHLGYAALAANSTWQLMQLCRL
jgi:hypothetical protein